MNERRPGPGGSAPVRRGPVVGRAVATQFGVTVAGVAVAMIAAACAPAGGPPGTGADGAAPRSTFAYRAPEAPLTYTLNDAVTVTYGGGPMRGSRVESSYFATMRLDFDDRESGLRVRGRVVDFSGELRSPSTGITRVDEGDIRGEYVLRLESDGGIDLLDKPDVTGSFSEVVGSDDLFRGFFLRLPERPIARGVTWTDTIRIEEERPSGRESSTIVVRSTWESDTTLAGRTLRVVHSTLATDQRIMGATFEQHLSGTTGAATLWDPVRGLQVRVTEEGLLEGMLDHTAPGAESIPLSVRVRRELSLAR